jgi:hypothetical protein
MRWMRRRRRRRRGRRGRRDINRNWTSRLRYHTIGRVPIRDWLTGIRGKMGIGIYISRSRLYRMNIRSRNIRRSRRRDYDGLLLEFRISIDGSRMRIDNSRLVFLLLLHRHSKSLQSIFH